MAVSALAAGAGGWRLSMRRGAMRPPAMARPDTSASLKADKTGRDTLAAGMYNEVWRFAGKG